jgi:hypothetical protein
MPVATVAHKLASGLPEETEGIARRTCEAELRGRLA